MRVRSAAFTAIMLTATTLLAAPLGTSFTYQGQLKSQGVPLDGTVDLEVSLFDVESGGVALDLVELNNVAVMNGLFSVELDFGGSVFKGDARWLEVAVRSPHDPGGTEPFTTLSPRQLISATPYSLHTRGLYISENGRLAVGAEFPPYNISSFTNLSTGRGVYGLATNNTGRNYGLFGESHGSSGRGVAGWATASSGTTYGGNFFSESTSGCGVFGFARADTGTNYGVHGETGSPDGYAGYFKGGRNYFEGNVGIGTKSPVEKLHLGGSDANLLLRENGGSPFVEIGDTLSQRGYLQWQSTDNDLLLFTSNHDYPIQIGPTSSGGLFVDTEANNGHVGIGTNTPQYPLHVESSSSKAIFGKATGVLGIGVYGSSVGTGGRGVFGETSNITGYAGYFVGGRNYFQGNVGIGTTNPLEKLHLSGDNANILLRESAGNPYVEIGDTSTQRGYLQWQSTDNDLLLYTSGHDYAIRIGPWGTGGIFVDTDSNGGRIGIGTTTPQGALDVNGSIYHRGASLHADYVFDSDYDLESIEEHSDFMWSEGHLPAVPQATKDAHGRDIVEVGSHRRGILEELEKAHIYIELLNVEKDCLVDEAAQKDKRLAAVEAQLRNDAERLARLEELVTKLSQQVQGDRR